MAQTRWLPLESNPDVMNKYVQALGVPSQWEFVDVYGFDPELLMMVPRPVAAVLLLLPITDKAEANPIGSEEPGAGPGSKLYFIKQTIGNACGTIGLVHAICNNTDKITFNSDKHLPAFLKATESLSPEEKAKYLEADKEFGAAHEASAQEGQTSAPSRDDHVKCHFVAFVHKEGGLYELDGRKGAPVKHGATTAETLLEDSVGVVKKFMARDPEELNFTVVALAKV
jgi:ubiquitin carboxyl-terminal hydrolase L3